MRTTLLLSIPHEFKVACATYHLPIPEVLQLFIDYASFYDALSQKSEDSYRYATNVLLGYSIPLQKGISPAFQEHSGTALKYIKEIIRISLMRGHTESKKRKMCNPIVKKLFKIMERSKTQEAVITLEGEIVLKLSIDFCIICETHNCYPAEYLEHFMNHISLADTHARIGLGKVIVNHSMAFFYQAITLCKDTPNPEAHKVLQIQFIDDIQELHLWLFIVRDFEKRKKKYQELYSNYYQQLITAS